MTDAKERLIDVWIVELNSVYREVPFSVVADWLIQGRLLAQDRVRLTGQTKWHDVTNVPALLPYLPQPEPTATGDVSEAMEPVELFSTSAGEEEDEDVDMIPLIDISLVLLIFFMMTAAVNPGARSTIETPGAKYQLLTPTEDTYWLGIEPGDPGPKGGPGVRYSLGQDRKILSAPSTNFQETIDRLADDLDAVHGEVKLRLRAEKSLSVETIQAAVGELQMAELRMNKTRPAEAKLSFAILAEVSEIPHKEPAK